VADEAGPGGFALFRLLTGLGVACDIIAPSLVAVRAGDRVKSDRRDAKKLVRLDRAGELVFVRAPSVEQERLRDLVRGREDLCRARTSARHQVAKQLLRHGRVFGEGKKSWTLRHRAWVRRQRLDDPLAQRALEHALAHLASLDAQLAALDAELEQIARRLLIQAAWHYQHRPRRARTGPDLPPAVAARAWRTQVRLHHRHRSLTGHGKRSTVATVAVARALCGFLWAAMTHQPPRHQSEVAAA
jgi:transposase